MALIDTPLDIVVTDSCLGSGAFGVVLLGFDEKKGCQLAIKEIPLPSPPTTEPGSELSAAHSELSVAVTNEIAIMRHTNHPNLMKYYGARVALSPLSHTPVVQIVMEYVAGGSLGALIRRVGPIRPELAALYVRDVLCGLQYLHDECGVCHRDIKPDNILITVDGVCKLSDFGASKAIIERSGVYNTMLTSCVGSPPFMAPEVARGDPYGRSADIWSVGCLAVQLVTGQPPLFGLPLNANPMAVLYRIASSEEAIPELPKGRVFSEALVDFVKHCGERVAAQRPRARELLQHPWVVDPTEALETMPTPHEDLLPNRDNAALTTVEELLPDDKAKSTNTAAVIPRCNICDTGIALFSCDACRRQGLASDLCPLCWDKVHVKSSRLTHHKGPLLVRFRGEEEDPMLSGDEGDAGYMLPSGTFVDLSSGNW